MKSSNLTCSGIYCSCRNILFLGNTFEEFSVWLWIDPESGLWTNLRYCTWPKLFMFVCMYSNVSCICAKWQLHSYITITLWKSYISIYVLKGLRCTSYLNKSHLRRSKGRGMYLGLKTHICLWLGMSCELWQVIGSVQCTVSLRQCSL